MLFEEKNLHFRQNNKNSFQNRIITMDILSNKVLIFSAPSGSGKSTIVNHILGIYKDAMEFSISATSRAREARSKTAKSTTSSRRKGSAS